MSANKKSINIDIALGDEAMPKDIEWSTEGSGDPQSAKAMLISFFDKESRDTLKIDLWTTEMQIQEMDRFFYQTLRGMADTYFKATKNQQLASDMQKFVQYFGEKTEILPKT